MTLATDDMDLMSDCSDCTSELDALSAIQTVMLTSGSTDFTTLLTPAPPTQKMPMMSSDRKMVTMEPSAVERLRVKPVSDSLRK